jgi:tRNA-specific 2-thiouridylase
MRVLAAMSGGVDSAVAAALAVDAGHDVTGAHLALSKNPQSFRTGARGCCSVEDAHDARRAADMLGIPFYVWDLSDAGRTPNPCVRCNERIKFSAVLDRAIALGFDAVCTGHYARLVANEQGGVELHRSVDAAKDQSYVLGVLDQIQLQHSLFPLGGWRKSEVRAEAAARRLTVADKPDSHDICFIADGDTGRFLDRRLGTRVGDIVDAAGVKVGEHSGSHHFTVGQRRGLRLGVPAPDGRPRYVLDLAPVSNTVTVGPRESLGVRRIEGIRPRWTQAPQRTAWRGLVQLRAHGLPVQTRATATDDRVEMILESPVEAVAPGQAAVLYDGSRVVGSSTIAAAHP